MWETGETIAERTDSSSFSFLPGWVDRQIGDQALQGVEARLTKTQADLDALNTFLQTEWPNVTEKKARIEAEQRQASPRFAANESGVQNWLSLARKYLPAPIVVTPPKPPLPVDPAPSAADSEGNLPGSAGKHGITPAPSDPKLALRDNFRRYAQSLAQRTGTASYSLKTLRDEQTAFEKLRAQDWSEIQNEQPVLAIAAAFKALPATTAAAGLFTLPDLEAKGWKLDKSGPDFAVYWRDGPASIKASPIKVPFHRLPGSDYAISAIEIPLLYVALAGWVPSHNPPDGPQVWMRQGGALAAAPGWLWPALQGEQTFLNSREDLQGEKTLYREVPKPQPWSIPMTGITGPEADKIAENLGGSLPGFSEYDAAIRAFPKDGSAHLRGADFNRQLESLTSLAVRLSQTRWRQASFQATPNAAVWPDTGSYHVSFNHAALPEQGKAAGLWFLPADRDSSSNPARIYDLYGNVAEYVKNESGYAIVGGSAISAPDPAAAANAQKADRNRSYSDVGFRMLVRNPKSGDDAPLPAFRTAILNAVNGGGGEP